MSACPICQKPVDPLRARAVAVRSGVVVAYCSLEHKLQDEKNASVPVTAPVVAPVAESKPPAEPKTAARTPAKGTPVVAPALDSGPVIEIIRGEPSGPEAVPKPVGKADSKPTKRARTEPPVPPPARAKSEPGLSSKFDTSDKSAPVVVKPVDDVKSGPTPKVIEAERSSSRAVPAPRDLGRTTPTGGTRLPTAPIQPPPDYDDDDLGPPEQPRSKAPLIVIVVLVIAAIGIAVAVKMMQKGHGAADATGVTKPPPGPPPPPPPKPDKPVAPAPPVTRDAIIAKAHEVLVAQLVSDSPHVQQRAAEALSRTGDKQAIEVLARMLAKETSDDLRRVDIAYALARAGDKRGTDALVSALALRRDVRAEAASRLAWLKDQRAVPVLADYLDIPQLRLGAADALAYVGEPRALKVLDNVRADASATPDDKARATISLARAGRTDVAPALEDLLAANSASAAVALAHLHDPAAHDPLVAQLKTSQLRVGAAEALRELDPKLDPMPLLPPLVEAMSRDKDTEQIDAAEAIVILTADAPKK